MSQQTTDNTTEDNSVVVEVKNLQTAFKIKGKYINAVDGCSFTLKRGKTLGIVGESGCGKSVTSLSIMGLIPTPPGKIVGGEILFKGKNLLNFSEAEMRKTRGNHISMIFQEPMTSLNPVFTIGDQIGEVFRLHRGMNKAEARQKSIEMLARVKIPAPEARVDEYPHQLSGGMRQRVMIAMALACEPEVLIADEPTTALDVTIQAQILSLMNELQETQNMATMLITHDLGVVAETCDDVVVMYAGRVVEQGSVRDIFEKPSHPYTRGLLDSIPKLGQKSEKLSTIEGLVPSLGNFPSGCRFRDRCFKAADVCGDKIPPLEKVTGSEAHKAACLFPIEYNQDQKES